MGFWSRHSKANRFRMNTKQGKRVSDHGKLGKWVLYSGKTRQMQASEIPGEVGGDIPSNVPIMYPAPGKMGGNGGQRGKMGGNGGEMGCYGGRWGQITKIVGLGWTALVAPFSPFAPISPNCSPFFLGSFHQSTPPPQPCCQSKPCFFLAFPAPQIPIFPSSLQNFPQFPPISPHFS